MKTFLSFILLASLLAVANAKGDAAAPVLTVPCNYQYSDSALCNTFTTENYPTVLHQDCFSTCDKYSDCVGVKLYNSDSIGCDIYRVPSSQTCDATNNFPMHYRSSNVPSAPTNVVAANILNGYITVSFDASCGADTYSVYGDNQLLMEVTSSPAVITAVERRHFYVITVTATNSIGTSARSAEVTIVSATVPDVPTNIAATAGDSSATVTFDAPWDGFDETGMYFNVRSNPGNFEVNTTSTSVVVRGLTNGVSYTFNVWAYNSVGWSVMSQDSNAVVPGMLPPGPTNVVATNLFGGDIQVSWDADSVDITSFIVYGDGKALAEVAASPAVLTNVERRHFYVITVAANYNNGTTIVSDAINIVSATVPDAPTNVVAVAYDSGASIAFDVPWDGFDLTGLNYNIRSNPDSIEVNTTNNVAFITGLTNGVTYTFNVFAFNSVGWSAMSAASNEVVPTVPPKDTTPTDPKDTTTDPKDTTTDPKDTTTDSKDTTTDSKDSSTDATATSTDSKDTTTDATATSTDSKDTTTDATATTTDATTTSTDSKDSTTDATTTSTDAITDVNASTTKN